MPRLVCSAHRTSITELNQHIIHRAEPADMMSTSFVSKRPLWHDGAAFLFDMCAPSRADACTGVRRSPHMMGRADPADMMSKTFVSTRPPRLDVAATLLYTFAAPRGDAHMNGLPHTHAHAHHGTPSTHGSARATATVLAISGSGLREAFAFRTIWDLFAPLLGPLGLVLADLWPLLGRSEGGLGTFLRPVLVLLAWNGPVWTRCGLVWTRFCTPRPSFNSMEWTRVDSLWTRVDSLLDSPPPRSARIVDSSPVWPI